jgi:hypothetical protein
VYKERGLALPLASVRRTVYWASKRTAPLHHLFLVRSYGEGIRRASARWNSCRSRAEMEAGDQLRGALHGQTRGVPRGTTDRQDLGDMEREPTARPVGDGRGQPQGCLQDQEDIQEAGEEEGQRLPTPYYGVCEA